MYRLQEIVDRILSSKTTGALLDEMRKELRLVGVDYFCLFDMAKLANTLING